MKKLSLLICLLLVVFLAACSAAKSSTVPDFPTAPAAPGFAPPPEISMDRGGVVAPMPAPAPPQVLVTTDQQFASISGQQVSSDKMIVRTGNMALVVEDVNVAIAQITTMADGYTGYVVSSNVWQDRERLFGNISVRIPAESFDDAVRALRALAVDITSETSTSQDVTQEYTDLGAQLKNLEATEQQLLKILAKAETVKDILDVQRELSNTRGQIEQTKARMQYLERTSATSIITVSLQQSKLNLDFNASKTTVKEGENIFFSADVAGGFAPYSYQWDLGDKTTSTESGVVHAYNNGGKYTVTLTVTDDHGTKINKTRTDYISVIPGWSAGDIATGARNGLVTFSHVIVSILIWLGFFSPVWIIVGVILYLLWRRRRRGAS